MFFSSSFLDDLGTCIPPRFSRAGVFRVLAEWYSYSRVFVANQEFYGFDISSPMIYKPKVSILEPVPFVSLLIYHNDHNDY